LRFPAILAIYLSLAAGPAWAGPAADILAQHAYDGTLTEGVVALDPLMQKGDAEAKAARGALRFLIAIEHLSQAFYKHGFETASGGPMLNLPIMRIPVPPNPNPEKLDYAGFRTIFGALVNDLDAAESDLAQVGDTDVKLPLDLAKLRLDLNGDGKAAEYESIGRILDGLSHGDPSAVPPVVAFDTADIYWLRGYDRFISAFAQFLLAFNFQEAFDKTFHIYFPRAGLPLADKLTRTDPSAWSDGAVGDAIAFLHLISWDVAEPARLKDVRFRLKAMAEMSARSWVAARRETDSDREWLPNPKQTGVFPSLAASDEQIDTWLIVMSEFDAVLDGKKLLPHWRFTQGLNARRMFEDMKHFDLVLLVAGPDAVPWLENGPVSDMATWNRMMDVFQGNFLGYAMFFN
jgi:hypothetical protein